MTEPNKSISHCIAVLVAALLGQLPAHAAPRDAAEKVTWESARCVGSPLQCEPMDAVGYLFAPAAASAAVVVSHGSQGLDKNVFDNYVDPLNDIGIAVLVVDHYTPRGVGRVAEDMIAANAKGINVVNYDIDSLTAADWLRRTRNYKKIGHLGESFGAGAGLSLDKTSTQDTVTLLVRKTLRKWFSVKPMDAIVALYPFCGIRDEAKDKYLDTPLIIIDGDEDDATPAPLCQRYVPWMNERGARARIVVLPGQGHNFDFAHKRTYSPRNAHVAHCDILIERGGRVIDVPSGFAGADLGQVVAHCTAHGHSGGNSGNPRVAVPIWTEFLKMNLAP